MDLDTVIRFVHGVGFPAAVALFVLVRLERKLEQIRDALVELKLCLKGLPRS